MEDPVRFYCTLSGAVKFAFFWLAVGLAVGFGFGSRAATATVSDRRPNAEIVRHLLVPEPGEEVSTWSHTGC
jgi:hypothetical protein